MILFVLKSFSKLYIYFKSEKILIIQRFLQLFVSWNREKEREGGRGREREREGYSNVAVETGGGEGGQGGIYCVDPPQPLPRMHELFFCLVPLPLPLLKVFNFTLTLIMYPVFFSKEWILENYIVMGIPLVLTHAATAYFWDIACPIKKIWMKRLWQLWLEGFNACVKSQQASSESRRDLAPKEKTRYYTKARGNFQKRAGMS